MGNVITRCDYSPTNTQHLLGGLRYAFTARYSKYIAHSTRCRYANCDSNSIHSSKMSTMVQTLTAVPPNSRRHRCSDSSANSWAWWLPTHHWHPFLRTMIPYKCKPFHACGLDLTTAWIRMGPAGQPSFPQAWRSLSTPTSHCLLNKVVVGTTEKKR